MLHENSLTQITREPKHIHGNTLDLLCVNDTSIVCSTKVITPGLSDHSIITAEVKYGSFVHQDEHIADRREIRFHHKADNIKFRKLMSDTYDTLAQMSNVQDMWDHFSNDFR